MNQKNEMEEIWEIYNKCQQGDLSTVDRLFTSDEELRLEFKHNILKKILNETKKIYDSEFVNYNNKHKKFYPGSYDISDLNELLYSTIIELFICDLDKNKCATIYGIKSNLPINDGISLVKNISFFMDRQLNKRGEKSHLDTITNFSNNENNGELSLLDLYQENVYKKSNKYGRPKKYEEILLWFQKDMQEVYYLFKSDSSAIKALIETIYDREDTFIYSVEFDDLCLVSYNDLCKIIKNHTGKTIRTNNIPQCFNTMNERITDYLMYTLNGNYCRLFSNDLIKINELCHDYYTDRWNVFIDKMKEYEDIIILIINNLKGKIKYDIINLLHGEMDVLNDSPPSIADNLAKHLRKYFEEIEDEKIETRLKEYKINTKYCLLNDMYWNQHLDEKFIKIKIYKHEKIKYPKTITIPTENLVVYEGILNYYFCNKAKRISYCLSKNARKSNKKFLNFNQKIA